MPFSCLICRTNTETVPFKVSVQILQGELRYGPDFFPPNVPEPKTNEGLNKQAETEQRGAHLCSPSEVKSHDLRKLTCPVLGDQWEMSLPPSPPSPQLEIQYFYTSRLCASYLPTGLSAAAAADARVIFSHTGSREPPASLMPHTSAQGLNEGVWSALVCESVCVCACLCMCEKGGVLLFLFPHECCIFYLRTHMHGCTRLDFICTEYAFIFYDGSR